MASSFPLRQFTMVPGQDIDPLFLCPICQDSWDDPMELEPCGDIFCHQCIAAARAQHAAQPMIMENFQCPQCHTVVQSEKKPNRMLLNTVLEVEVECRYCHWKGTRESSAQHECEEGQRQRAKQKNEEEEEEKKRKAAVAGGGDWGDGPLPAAAVAPTPSGLSPRSASGSTSSAPAQVLSSSEAPLPARAHAPRRSTNTPSLTQSAPAVVSSPPGLRGGPRRAVQEIEGAFSAIEDDPTSTTFRTRFGGTQGGSGGVGVGGAATAASSSSLGASYDYGFQNSMSGGGGGGGNASAAAAGGGGGRGRADSHDQVLSSPLQPALGHNSFPSTTGPSNASNGSEPWRRYRLSQLEYDQLVGIYMMFDEGEGRLNFSQLRSLCFCMNFVQRDEDVSVIFRAMDTQHKGYVTQEDFLHWLSTHRPDESALFGLSQFEYTDAVLQFRTVDPEFNGVIDANDFCALCLTNGYARTPADAMRLFHLCDDRHTGYVSLQQYLRTLKYMKTAAGAGGGPSPSSPASAAPAYANARPSASAQSSGSRQPSAVHESQTASLGSATPQMSDYWSNDAAPAQGGGAGGRAASTTPPQSQQHYSMVDYFPPQGNPNHSNHPNNANPAYNLSYPSGTAAPTRDQQQQPPPEQRGQRFMTSLNTLVGDARQLRSSIHPRQSSLPPQPPQQQQQQPQQPYSQATRSTASAAATNTPQQQQQQQRSRLHRPTARPQREEECVVM